jgi:glucokinase
VLLVTLGTGIGGGLISGGRLILGANGFAGEVGHMTIDHDGRPCPCGQRGCWERYASGSSLGRLGEEAATSGAAPRLRELAGGDPAAVRGEHVGAAAAGGDAGALAVLAQFGEWVALGLVNLAALLDPQRVVVGGGLVELGDLLFDPVRASFARLLAGGRHRPPVEIVPAGLGEAAGAIGAALLARPPPA